MKNPLALRAEQIECQEQQGGAFIFRVRDVGGREQEVKVTAPHLPEDSILAALAAYRLLGFDLTAETAATMSRVELPGRFQHRFFDAVPVILDVAHNPQAASYLANNLKKEPSRSGQRAAITGVMADKSITEIFEPLCPEINDWYLVVPNIPRAASLQTMRQKLLDLGVASTRIHDVGEIAALEPLIGKMPAAVVFGSFYTVGEFLDNFGDRLE